MEPIILPLAELTTEQTRALKNSAFEDERNADIFLNDNYIAFSHLYHQGAYSDVSLVAFAGENPVARLNLFRKDRELSFFGFPAKANFLSDLDPGTKNYVASALLSKIEEIAAGIGNATLKLDPGENLARGLYSRPHRVQVHYLCGVDLSASEAELKHSVRRSYRSLINWGKKNLQTEILYGPEGLERFDAFRQLHLEVAGRVTRPASSWEYQKEQVGRRQAFVVLCSLEGEVVAGALTLCSGSNAYYGVAAANRTLMADGKALGHWPMWSSLLHAQQIGLKQYLTGYFPDEEKSAKENSINAFKLGFCTFVRPLVSWEIQFDERGEARDE